MVSDTKAGKQRNKKTKTKKQTVLAKQFAEKKAIDSITHIFT